MQIYGIMISKVMIPQENLLMQLFKALYAYETSNETIRIEHDSFAT
jgi:hypothetical protein